MEFLDFIFYIAIIYFAFKAGLHIGRFKLWAEIAEINKRIKSEMDPIIKDFERRERLSYQQCNKIKK